ncbi:GNAT family N-acetyltransferase [Nocardia pseudobrasiliensis]|uniref:RimJ/RimL family protein N-acetyltransferase n=1 Tax=Nocardia pseudobrasiliensis TaxID=45979 RepID=A0A370ICF5_9NOCA|nr:GNAT family N-acetyltransferase [Nocardia pseudobrasiliensis]RDI68409.1 RimJ/RimL family protein N-acetyltransferase [Nocardia pseudobrasiliensis]
MALLIEPFLASDALVQLPQPILRAEDIVLRPWQAADVPVVVEAYSEPDIRRWHVRSMTEAEAREWVAAWPDRWNAGNGAGWAVADDSGVVGQISLRRLILADGLAEVSYWILPRARGRGLAATALSALTAWSFGELGLHRIEIRHSTSNPGSCRVARKAGYSVEGMQRRAGRHADGWHDVHLHARLGDD